MKRGKVETADRWAVGWAARALVLLILVSAFTIPTGILPIISMVSANGEPVVQQPGPSTAIIPLGGPSPTPTVAPVVSLTPHTLHVGIISGHWGNGADTGAVCPDGLREVDINLEIARRVEAQLSQHGWQVDLLEEFDPRLNNYQADALISIHSDSCTYPGKTGFKAARAESSYIPVSEDRFLNCVVSEYAISTGLPFDANTVTYDMTQYHAYYEIDRMTPALIIETGFMLDDRELLTQHPDRVAQGIVNGLICFLEEGD